MNHGERAGLGPGRAAIWALRTSTGIELPAAPAATLTAIVLRRTTSGPVSLTV